MPNDSQRVSQQACGSESTPPERAEACVLTVLSQVPDQVLFVSELMSRLGAACPERRETEAALRVLASQRKVGIFDFPRADPCLQDTDLRVAAAVSGSEQLAGAQSNALRYWSRWARQFLSQHRCT